MTTRGRAPERDRGPQTRINDAIRADKVRLIGPEGEQIGITPLREALEFAFSRNLDLVEVAAEARPPVCKVLDYGKYRYEQEQKTKLARKHQSQIVIKEIKFRPKIGAGDYKTKKGHVVRFLMHRDKVKVTIMFRGREVQHPERGEALLLRLAEELKEIAIVEAKPNLDGRNMVMMLAPSKNVPERPKVDTRDHKGERGARPVEDEEIEDHEGDEIEDEDLDAESTETKATAAPTSQAETA